LDGSTADKQSLNLLNLLIAQIAYLELNMNRLRDAVIIGAGPAGSSMAMALAGQGWDVLLLERDHFPRHKVCGEFLSPEAQVTLQTLGLQQAITTLKPAPVVQTQLVTQEGVAIHIPLPGCGWGISRFALDGALASAAEASNVELWTGTTVTRYEQMGDEYVVYLQAKDRPATVRTRALIAACGRHTQPGLPPQARALDRKYLAVGVKGHYVGIAMPPTVELFFFPGGYAGVSPVEEGRVNVCLLTSYTAFSQAGKRVETMFAAAATWNKALGQRLAGGCLLPETAITVAPVDVYRPATPWDGVACLGDAAAMIPPLCGDGMAMALRSTALCAPLAHDYLRSSLSLPGWASEYRRRWHAEFDRRLRVGRLVQRLLALPVVSDQFVRLGRLVPGLANYLVRATRGNS
jgi:flavin-dependent dehydrogenase